MLFQVTVLGISAAQPAFGRHPSGQIVQVQDHTYLLDCGEGTQMRLTEYGIRRAKVNHIFISHLHGDHYFGLFGLLTSMGLNGRHNPLHIHCPDPLLRSILELIVGPNGQHLGFPLEVHTHSAEQKTLILEESWGKVYALPLAHRITTTGYYFEENPFPANMRADKIVEHQIHFSEIPRIKRGGDYVTPEGDRIPHAQLTIAPRPPRSFAYCSDTAYVANLAALISGVDLLYHESTFCEDSADRALQTGHSTAKQAARLAKEAEAKQLLLGHFSSRYPTTTVFQEEAQSTFPNALIAEEGKTYPVGWQK
ncbi:MAG: ribonuclease Z [Bacteroidota bacterium]